MSDGCGWTLVAFALADRTLAILMAVGMTGLFAILATLVWTRWGQARPVSKCIVLSLLAHLLLLVYAYSTQVLFGPPGSWTGQTVTVRIRDAADDREAARATAVDPTPWSQPGADDVPLAESLPENDRVPVPPNELRRAEVATADPPIPQPQPPELLKAPAPAPPSPPPLVPDKPSEPAPLDQPALAEKPPAPSEPSSPDPFAGLPDELITPQAPEPRLTDLLPDHDGPSVDTARADAATPPENPLRDAGDIPPSPTSPLEPQFTSTAAASVPRRIGDGREVPAPLRARLAADRLMAAQPFGASPRTEAAVAAALDWLAAAQSADGRWDADAHGAGRETRTLGHDRRGAGAQADTGVSGLALLAFLGSGETHLSGQHRETVQRGLEFLLASQAADGSLAGQAELFAAMYCHGIATLALSEAYALSGDDRLLPGLKRALLYSIESQHSGGGWRYQPFDAGDMSQFGWQLMALKSAELGGLPVPETTKNRMTRFLRSCTSGKSRGLASYRPGDRVSRSMTAEALVCRYFLAAENSPAASDEAAAYLGEERPGQGAANYYYWYYGTLALYQRQGEDWTRWNSALQSELLGRQRWDAAASGSWDPDDQWGGYGGRVYSTALATLSLEVYYRYLPLYGQDANDTRLTDRPAFPALPR